MLHFGMMTTGRTIQRWRVEKGLTQQELALRSGIARPNLCLIEQDARDLTLSTLRKIAQALEIKASLLVDGVSPESLTLKKWSRESLDRIARYLVARSREQRIPLKLIPEEKVAAEKIFPLVRQILQSRSESSGKSLQRRGLRLEKENWRSLKASFGDAEIQNLLSRIHKIVGTLRE
jgi:transcriptional regulator with XRE-family HTH domain